MALISTMNGHISVDFCRPACCHEASDYNGWAMPPIRSRARSEQPVPTDMNLWAVTVAMARFAGVVIVSAGVVVLAGSNQVPSAEPELLVQRPRLALFGTVIGNGNAVAMFNDQSTGGVVSLRVGDVYGGWRLGSIEAGRATFENDGQKAAYPLSERASRQQPLPYIAPAPLAPAAQADRLQARTAGTSSPGGTPGAKGSTDDPVVDWFRRQRR